MINAYFKVLITLTWLADLTQIEMAVIGSSKVAGSKVSSADSTSVNRSHPYYKYQFHFENLFYNRSASTIMHPDSVTQEKKR